MEVRKELDQQKLGRQQDILRDRIQGWKRGTADENIDSKELKRDRERHLTITIHLFRQFWP